MKYYIVDAFTEGSFKGNPAGVCLLNMDSWPEEGFMQDIAEENNLSETAFLVKVSSGKYNLRWFTPVSEVDLCGHATLASAFVVLNFMEKGLEHVSFSTISGELWVSRRGDLYTLDFPERMPDPIELTPEMSEAIGAKVLEAHGSRDLVLLLGSEKEVSQLNPDMTKIAALPGYLGICVTARGESADFVSRYFAPLEGIPEDPVTGSAHCSLAPFWAKRLNKSEMTALQLSKRGGKLHLRMGGRRVEIAGKARLYLEGTIYC